MKPSASSKYLLRDHHSGSLAIIIGLMVVLLAGAQVPVSAQLDNEPPEIVDFGMGFLSGWGWGVADGEEEYQTCTGPCQAGIAGIGVGQLNFPSDIGLSADGTTVYVLNKNNHRVDVFSSAGVYQSTFGSEGTGAGELSDPSSIVVDEAQDRIFINDTGSNRLSKYDLDGNFIETWGWGVDTGAEAFETCTTGCTYGRAGAGDGQFDGPYGIALSPDGATVYVTETGNDRIQMLAAVDGTYLGQFGSLGSGAGQVNQPLGIAVDSSGNIYVADRDNQRLDKFDSDGTFLMAWGVGVAGGVEFEVCTTTCEEGVSSTADGGFQGVVGVSVDSAGNVYTTDQDNNRIQRFSSEGVFYEKYGSEGTGAGQFTLPFGVMAAPDGSVYVVDMLNNRVIKLAKYPSVTLDEDGAPAPFDLTLQAVDPENNTLTWSISTPAGHGTATASGTGSSKEIGYTPAANYNGSDSFDVQVSDGELTDTITVNLTINPIDDAPQVTSTAVTTAARNMLYSYSITAIDVDGDGVIFSAPGLPAWLELVDHHDGTATLSGTPGNAELGGHKIDIVVTDTELLSDTQTFTIEVTILYFYPFIQIDAEPLAPPHPATLLPGTE